LIVQIGINQDVVFKGERFHVQTEDSGVKRPVISTVLFKGGIIVASRKSDYSDRLDSKDLDNEVKKLMQSQHKDIIRALKNGDFIKDNKAKAADKKAASPQPSPRSSPEPSAGPEPTRKQKGKRPLKVSKKVLEAKVLECLSLK